MLAHKPLRELFDDVYYADYRTSKKCVGYDFKIDKNGVLEICFEGNDSVVDRQLCSLCAKKPYKDMETKYKVHKGFLSRWKKIEKDVISRIKREDVKSICVLGYGSGGALAALCHEACWFHRPDLRDSLVGVAFCAPKVYAGFKVKKELLPRWERFFVVRNDSDIVTHCPLRIFGYTHVGNIIHVGKGRSYGLSGSHKTENVREVLEGVEL